MSPKPPPREQEQSIRARKEQIYDEDEPVQQPVDSKPRKPFTAYLQETPAAPLSGTIKAILWTVGAVVVLLMVATLLRSSRM